MPELPEVENVRRGLERVLLQEQIAKVEVFLERIFVGDPHALVGTRFVGVGRRGKALLLQTDREITALIHLRMTGQLIFLPPDGRSREGGGHPSDALIQPLPNKHTHVILTMEEGGRLFFNDQRTFGSIKLFETHRLAEEPFLQKLGPEPWDEAFSAAMLYQACQARPRSSIKALLLDQSLVAGIGNIYADEALFLSQLHPQRPAKTIQREDAVRLIEQIRYVLERGILYGGVSARDYVNAEGLRGTMQEQLFVYGREGEACKKCETILEKSRVAGRGTHTCPQCQPLLL